ncbi:Hypothetical predicted protein [Olea europaea subsp. europaea]|uniref:Uncharacterized protein n=1 Tax=Olea europaea subsp. europaea TaxID=158383 RepID=A0A8S0TN74_OLEEU|nr:Hypothetical predicted protein [Olea europaea subsp. europaea]
MEEPQRHVQVQLANSQNNEVMTPKREVDVDMDMDDNYATNQIIEETVVPSKYSRVITPRGLASVFDRLGPIRSRQIRPRILHVQTRLPPIPLSQPHLSNPPSLESQHVQPQPETATELAPRYMHSSPRNRCERQAILTWMRNNPD